MSRPRLLAIVGPTASGKSSFALELAQRHQKEILSCDSVQVYRGLDIGSAKPTAEEQACVAHHLIDVVQPDALFSAGDYARLARPIVDAENSILCGGTGLYLRALAFAQTQPPGAGVPKRDDPRRVAFESLWIAREQESVGAAHRGLVEVDPSTAVAIHPNNISRVIQALWLCELHGEPVSKVRERQPPVPLVDVWLVVLSPPATELAMRIRERCLNMFDRGWVEEVEALRDAGYGEEAKGMGSLGYRQILRYLDGALSREAAVEETISATTQYARRQRTYFRSQLPCRWRTEVSEARALSMDRVSRFFAGEDD